jgi:phosphoglycolate phosphatase
MYMKLIMFDYDGVLVDSFQFLKKVYLRIADVLGIEMQERDEYFQELLELDWRETYRKLDILAKDKVNISEFIFQNHNHKHSKDIMPYPDIPSVLEILSKNYRLAVVSNNFRKELEYRLKRHGLIDYFSAIYSSEDGELKPHPDLILKCMKQFDASPDESAFIGDMDGDILAAKRAGVGKKIAVTYGYHTMHRLKDADIIVHNPKEILKHFE